MIKKLRLTRASLVISGILLACGVTHADPASNAELVKSAMTDLFIKRDASAVNRYWSKQYIQHNPGIANGSAELPGLIKALPADFKYEPGLIVAQGNIVMIHGRYTKWGPKPMIGVDIFRIEGGKLVEHWDVLQEEVPAGETKSGNPMFKPAS